MATVVRTQVSFQAALLALKEAVFACTGTDVDDHTTDEGRLNDALSDAYQTLWSRDEATIKVTLFDTYLNYPVGDPRNPPRSELEFLLVCDPPGPLPRPGDASVPWSFDEEDLSEVFDAVELPLTLQLDIEDMYDVPGLKDVVREHIRAAYPEVRAIGEGFLRFVAETPGGSKTVSLRMVRRAAE